MSRVAVLSGMIVAALVLAPPALADQSKSVTATGTGLVTVVPKNRHSNSSIAAAVDAARRAGIAGAMRQAHEYALEYAAAAGLTLAAVVSVSDAQPNGPGYFGPGFFGPFGPNRFCGTLRRPVFKGAGRARKVTGFKRVHRCFVPGPVATTLTVTYTAT